MQEVNYDVFISYRREGGEDLATLFEERLTRLGYRVFFDVESLRSGDFNKNLLVSIEHCTDFLLILPPHGLDRCINNPNDWVRQEIRHALKHKKNVVPVMKKNFVFPEDLPEDIADVSNMNGIAASMDDFNAVINRLVTKFLHSKPVDEDDETLRSRAESGDVIAINELALRYEKGSASIISNTMKAMELYLSASEKGCFAADYNLGDIYERCSEDFTLINDYGIKIDHKNMAVQQIAAELKDIALVYYEKAAENEYPPAQYKLGNIHENNKDYEKAFECYSSAARAGYSPAQNALGFFYQFGIGVEKNIKEAFLYYEQAVKSQYAPALYNLAMLIQVQDPEKALNLLRRVAFGEKAIPVATYALGRLYELSFSDIRNAVECYKLAAEYGITAAEADLERCRYIVF